MHRPPAPAQTLTSPGAARRRQATAGRIARAVAAAVWLGIAGSAPAADPDATSAAPRPNPISEPGRLWAFDGFSLKPPGGGEWYSLDKSRTRVMFARHTVDPAYALVASVVATRVDHPPATPAALAAIVRRRAPQSPDPDRFEIKENSVDLDPAASWCVRYRLLAEDARESFFYPRIVRISGRVCAHPDSRALLVDASYAERAIEGDSQPEALDEGDAFVSGVRLTRLHSVAVTAADALFGSGSAHEAVKLIAPLAEQGDAQAAQLLGVAYERGQGVTRDATRANRWYLIAAEAGEVDALYNLGALHDHAAGNPRDAEAAWRWFRRAADQRDAQAQLNLGLLYLRGDGVAEDADQARFWLGLAASNGNARARALSRKLFP